MFGDGTIIVSSHAVEAVKELLEDLLSGLSSIDEVLVLRYIIDCVNIFNGDCAIAAAINQSKCLVDHVLAALGKWVTEASNELLVGNVAITVDIVKFHERLNLDNLREEAESIESFSEL